MNKEASVGFGQEGLTLKGVQCMAVLLERLSASLVARQSQ